MIGYCGLDCGGCPIHRATLETDAQQKLRMRGEIARICRERYGLSLSAEDVGDCDGCRSTRLFVTCAACEIRRCARAKNLESCASCDALPCENVEKIFLEDPSARSRLNAARGPG